MTQKDKYEGPMLDPDTRQVPDVSVVPARRGLFHVYQKRVKMTADPLPLCEANGYARRLMGG